MSYALSLALQQALYQRLTSHPDLATVAIHDSLPAGPPPACYVLLGAEEVRDRSLPEVAGAEHRFSLSVVAEATGFAAAKEIAAHLHHALTDVPLTLAQGRLVGLWFDRASARRTSSGGRRIDLRFRARLEDS